MSTIQFAMRGDKRVSIGEARRGEQGLMCFACSDRLVVKDGGGRYVSGVGNRHNPRRKHFSHTANSKCRGESDAHRFVKAALCEKINHALAMPEADRNFHGLMFYGCQDPEYGPNDFDKSAPGANDMNREFESLAHGYHQYDLLHRLHKADNEVWLAKDRHTRADVAGKDEDGNVLWAIEVKRTSLSRAAVAHAETSGIPMFVIDLTKWPKSNEEDPYAEFSCLEFDMLAGNLERGFYPSVAESYNTECERRAFGMGPHDNRWSKQGVFIHRGSGDCLDNEECPGCEEEILHGCAEVVCPDWTYMLKHDITPVEMYMNPVYRAKSHQSLS